MSTIALRCLVSGDGKEKVFTIEIAPSKDVSILKDLIRDKVPVLGGIAANDIQLVKVSLPTANAEQARDPGNIEDAVKLSPTDQISEVFQAPEKGYIHVIVVKPTVSLECCYPAENRALFSITIRKDTLITDLLGMLYQMLQCHGHKVSLKELRVYKTDIPFDPRHSIAYRARQFIHEHPGEAIDVRSTADKVSDIFPLSAYGGERLNILLSTPECASLKVATVLRSRPTCVDRVPVAMFSPPLAKLQQNLNNLEALVPSRSDIDRATAFLGDAVQLYMTKEEHQQHTEPHVDKLLGANGEWQETLDWASNIKPDAVWWHKDFALLILELKKMPGNGGDAVLQATADYNQILMGEKFEDLWGSCNFPVILLGISGTRIEVSAAVCVGPIYVSTLYTLDLALGVQASANATQLARVFNALSSARTDLINYYDEIPDSPSASSQLTAVYPDPTFVDARSPPLTFSKFTARKGESTFTIPNWCDSLTFIYNATLDTTGQEVVVKFTRRYNQAAHAILSNRGLAPKLHFCGRIVGELYMVVMDRVKGMSLWELLQEGVPIPAFVLEKVEKAISYLHDANVVFGDLRDANILCFHSEESDGLANRGVFLIDFDWAGKDGQDLYPATLNTENPWEESVRPLGVMRKAHDMWQVDRLKRQCARNP